MYDLLRCLVFAAVVGLLSNPIAALLDRSHFQPDGFLFRPWDWEQGGKVYRCIGVHKWKDKVPDMSKILRGMTEKKVRQNMDADQIHRVAQETCVAEFVHWCVSIVCLAFFLICKSRTYALIYWILNFLILNLPFIIIQRFNRPRLVRLEATLREKNVDYSFRPERQQPHLTTK